MADILPYLGVKQVETPGSESVILEDYTGLTAAQAQKKLSGLGIGCLLQGTGDTVTAQLPLAGQTVSGNSQIILYLGGSPEDTLVEMPDFTGMTRQQAVEAAGALGLFIAPRGNREVAVHVTVQYQSVPAKTKIKVGSVIELTFVDTKAAD